MTMPTYGPPPHPHRRPGLSTGAILAIIVGGFGLILVVAIAAAVYASTHQRVTVTGTMTISSSIDGGEQCTGTGGYNDITPGASVIIHDATGKVIAAGQLGPGKGSGVIADIAATCRFKFRVTGVPASRFYGIAIGHRNTVQFTAAQVKAGDVALSLDTPTG